MRRSLESPCQILKTTRDGQVHEFVKFTTPSGVTAVVDRSIPREALLGFIAKLQRKQARRLRASGR